MDRAITATEANERFSDVLRDVAAGDSFTVTSDGRPVARVVPAKVEVDDRREAMQQLLDHVRDLPIRHSGPWTRDELYE